MILISVLVASLLGLFIFDPIPQGAAYHLFADARSMFGIPNFNDVASNAGFAIVGVIGLFLTHGTKHNRIFKKRLDAWPYFIFFRGRHFY